jgi:hypothetical protein
MQSTKKLAWEVFSTLSLANLLHCTVSVNSCIQSLLQLNSKPRFNPVSLSLSASEDLVCLIGTTFCHNMRLASPLI